MPRGDVGVAKLRAPTCAEFTYAVNLNAHKPHNLILRTIYFLYGIFGGINDVMENLLHNKQNGLLYLS